MIDAGVGVVDVWVTEVDAFVGVAGDGVLFGFATSKMNTKQG